MSSLARSVSLALDTKPTTSVLIPFNNTTIKLSVSFDTTVTEGKNMVLQRLYEAEQEERTMPFDEFAVRFNEYELYRIHPDNGKHILLKGSAVVIHYSRGHVEPDQLVFKKHSNAINSTSATELEMRKKIDAMSKEVEQLKQQLREAKDTQSPRAGEIERQLEEQMTLLSALQINLLVFKEMASKTTHRTGWLVLQQGSSTHRRFFQLSDGVLLFFKKETDKKPEGAIPLGTQARVVWCSEDRKQIYIKPSFASDSTSPTAIQAMKQTEYFLTASNEEEAWEWVEAISAFTTDTVDTDATEEEAPLRRAPSLRKMKLPTSRIRTRSAVFSKTIERASYQGYLAEELRPLADMFVGAVIENGPLSPEAGFRAGTSRQILAWLLLGSSKPFNDNIDVQIWMMGYWLYQSNKEFLDCLLDIWNTIKPIASSLGLDEPLRTRLLNLTEQIMIAPPVTFDGKLDEELRNGVHLVVRGILGDSEHLSSCCSKRWQPLRGIAEKSPLGEVDRIALPLLECKSGEIAAQMTLFEAKMWRKIFTAEFLDMRWQKHKEQAPNLVLICEHFNNMAYWVSHSVIEPDNVKEQVKRFKKFLHVSKRLLELRNYQSACQIYSGLTDAAIVRLSRFKQLGDDRYTEMMHRLHTVFDPRDNYKAYRALSFEPPSLLFMAVHLRDITFVQDGNPLLFDNIEGHVNFDRLRLLYRSIAGMKLNLDATTNYSHLPCNHTMARQIQEIEKIEKIDLYQRSIQLEQVRKVRRTVDLHTLAEQVEEISRDVNRLKVFAWGSTAADSHESPPPLAPLPPFVTHSQSAPARHHLSAEDGSSSTSTSPTSSAASSPTASSALAPSMQPPVIQKSVSLPRMDSMLSIRFAMMQMQRDMAQLTQENAEMRELLHTLAEENHQLRSKLAATTRPLTPMDLSAVSADTDSAIDSSDD